MQNILNSDQLKAPFHEGFVSDQTQYFQDLLGNKWIEMFRELGFTVASTRGMHDETFSFASRMLLTKSIKRNGCLLISKS
jgi:hypothetical protein